MEEFLWKHFFDLVPEKLHGLFEKDLFVWNVLDNLKPFLRKAISPNLPEDIELGLPLPSPRVLLPGGWLDQGFELVCNDETKGKLQVWIDGERVEDATLVCAGAVFGDSRIELGRGVLIEPGAMIKGPTMIMDNTQVRQGAYLREDCLIGPDCVVGHVTEVKHSIFLQGAKAGHFAYVGDSILGNNVNLGAGTKLANLKFAPGNVKINTQGSEKIDTGRRKLGAVLGDDCQTGCNSVTNPGSLIGKGSLIAPNSTVSPGYYKPKTIIR